jgi:hypothetical protein
MLIDARYGDFMRAALAGCYAGPMFVTIGSHE